jgi:hypothetical protein
LNFHGKKLIAIKFDENYVVTKKLFGPFFHKLIWSPCTELALAYVKGKILVSSRVARWFVFSQKIPNFGKFWRVLQWKILVYFMTIWSIFGPLEIFYGHFGIFCGHLVYCPPFWYFVPRKIWQPWSRVTLPQSFRGNLPTQSSQGVAENDSFSTLFVTVREGENTSESTFFTG